MGSAYFEFDSVGPVSATSEELTKYEWSYDLLVEHVRKLGDLDKEYKKLSDRTKKISEDLDKKIKGNSPKMEDKYINTTIVKGVGAALKAFAIEVPNMVHIQYLVLKTLQRPLRLTLNNQHQLRSNLLLSQLLNRHQLLRHLQLLNHHNQVQVIIIHRMVQVGITNRSYQLIQNLNNTIDVTHMGYIYLPFLTLTLIEKKMYYQGVLRLPGSMCIT